MMWTYLHSMSKSDEATLWAAICVFQEFTVNIYLFWVNCWLRWFCQQWNNSRLPGKRPGACPFPCMIVRRGGVEKKADRGWSGQFDFTWRISTHRIDLNSNGRNNNVYGTWIKFAFEGIELMAHRQDFEKDQMPNELWLWMVQRWRAVMKGTWIKWVGGLWTPIDPSSLLITHISQQPYYEFWQMIEFLWETKPPHTLFIAIIFMIINVL